MSIYQYFIKKFLATKSTDIIITFTACTTAMRMVVYTIP